MLTFSLHPGLVKTEISRDIFGSGFNWLKLVYYLLLPLVIMIVKNPKEGAQTTLYCSLEDDLEKFNGQYFRYKIMFD